MQPPRAIPNASLTPSDVPPDDADWGDIQAFALTFNGYETHGSFEACARIANDKRARTLTDLRTCLFFEQRRWRHFGRDPGPEDMAYIRTLVHPIREKLTSGSVE
jgi:hypothetical protein